MAKPATKSIGPKQKGILTIVSGLSLKFIPAFVMGVMFHSPAERLVDYFINHNVPVAETSYQDLRGADTAIYTNENGERQLYLVTEGENAQKVPIDRDLLPPESELEKRLLERYKQMQEEQARDIVPFLSKQQEIIYGKIRK
jgi:hypothetical protein